MRNTSKQAYDSIRYDLGTRQLQVFNAIKSLKKASNLDISQYLKMPINSITPRTKELVDMGVVEEIARDKHPITNRRVIFWGIPSTTEQLNLLN